VFGTLNFGKQKRGFLCALGKQALLDGNHVILGHFVVLSGHHPGLISVVVGDLTDNFKEGRQLGLAFLSGALYSDNRGMVLQVQESLHHEVLPIVDEALARLDDLLHGDVGVLAQLDVLTRSNLPLFLNFLAIDFVAHLMTISKRVVFADFAQNVSLTHLGRNERLLELEAFFLDASGHVNLWVTLIGSE